MIVLSVITKGDPVDSLVRWSDRMAASRDGELVFLVVENQPNPTAMKIIGPDVDPPSDLVDEVRAACMDLDKNHEIRFIKHPDTAAAVMGALEVVDEKLLILSKQEEKKGPDSWARTIITKAPCDTVLIRPGEDSGGACTSILVPVSDGPHARVALRLAEDLLVDVKDGNVTAMNVTSGIAQEDQAAGRRLVEREIINAGVLAPDKVGTRVVTANDPFQGIATVAGEDHPDLVLIGATNRGPLRRFLFGTVPRSLMDRPQGTTVAIIRKARPLAELAQETIVNWISRFVPQLQRDQRVELYNHLGDGSQGDFDFFTLISLSTAIAGLGLLQDSAAVVIGAMLVAPLMTPMIGSGLGIVQGNINLVRDAAKSIFLGFFLAFLIGWIVGIFYFYVMKIFPPDGYNEFVHKSLSDYLMTDELRARTVPGFLDWLVALTAGFAAAYATARPGLSGALPGVAISAALVPPIATGGIMAAFGQMPEAEKAVMLFVTNMVLVVLSASLALFMLGVRSNKEFSRQRVWTWRIILLLILVALILGLMLGPAAVAHTWNYLRSAFGGV